MAIQFEARHTDGFSRLGRLTTPHGTVRTPAFLPVVNPNLPTIPPAEMRRDFGVEMLITNSYIVRSSDALRRRALAEGLHAVVGFDGPIMTDSGTFQSYVYGDVRVEPDEIVAFQRDIGTDIGTILDVFSTPERTLDEARADVDATTQRARDAPAHAGAMALALTVQGGAHPGLRTEAAAQLRGVDHAGGIVHPVGGVVPLMERQQYATLARVVLAARRGLHLGRPIHLFGAGHPHVLPMAVLLGCDLFDSSAYAKFAKDDRLLFPSGTAKLADLEELPCACAACRSHTVDELRGIDAPARQGVLARHNLHVTMAELRRVREAQRRGSLWEMVIERAHAHPALHEVLPVLREAVDELETEEPLSKPSAAFLLPPWHDLRPEVARFRRRVEERFDARGRAVALRPPTPRPFLVNDAEGAALLAAGTVPVYPSRLGPVPGPLDEAYPAAQTVEPALAEMEYSSLLSSARWMVQRWGARPSDVGPAATDAAGWSVLESRARAVADHQFGPGAADLLFAAPVRIEASPRTGRIRTIHSAGEHILSLRASDGLYTLKLEGARRLRHATKSPTLRVMVEPETAAFNREGKNVMARYVLEVDDGLRPGDEVLVVTPDDVLVAVGEARLSVREMRDFERGVAVRVREGADRAGDHNPPDAPG